MARDEDIRGRTGIAEMVVRDLFERSWWAVALRGLIGVVIGIVAVTWPRVTLSTVLGLLGVYLLFDGVLTIVASFRASRAHKRWWPYLLEGLVSLGVGALAFFHPMAIAFALLLLVAFRSFVTGLVEIATAVWLRRETSSSQWFLWLAGLMSIAFGVALLFMPGAGALTLVWLAGFYTIVFGILEIVTAFMVKGVARRRFEAQPT
jgi:uncharacterized membrane protein HdeD (DUF308 family)